MTEPSQRLTRRRYALSRLVKEAGSATELALLTGTPKSHISAMQSDRRGVGDALAARYEQLMGKPAGWMDLPSPIEESQVHPVSLSTATIAPPRVSWEALNMTEKHPRFEVTLPDDAMAPDARSGTVVTLSRKLKPEPGDAVLVADSAGLHYLRIYRLLTGGRWEARPLNEAYATLESERDGLTIVAVLEAVHQRWSARN